MNLFLKSGQDFNRLREWKCFSQGEFSGGNEHRGIDIVWSRHGGGGGGILLSHKKEWNDAICSNVDGHRDDHTKWSKSDRERQILYDITYMWNLKYTNELIYKTEIDSQT